MSGIVKLTEKITSRLKRSPVLRKIVIFHKNIMLGNQAAENIILKKKENDIEKIVIHSTDICNINCKYCSRGIPFKKSNKSYFASEFIPWLNFLIQQDIIFEKITITGGEPFLHPDIFTFINELKNGYPNKIIRLVTNFFWADEKIINKYAPKLKNLDNLVISKYPSIIEKCGGNREFNQLVELLKLNCPNINIEVHELAQFISWELHKNKEPVSDICTTEQAKCYTLGNDGIVTRCVIACGAKNINEYKSILAANKEYLYDLKKWDRKEFLYFANKYPFDLCEHCTFTKYKSENWRLEDRIKSGELTAVAIN